MWFGKEDTQEVKELKAKVDDLQLLYLKEKSLKYTPRVSILDTSHDNNPLYCREAVQIKEVYQSLSRAVKKLTDINLKEKYKVIDGPLIVALKLQEYSESVKLEDKLSITTICSILTHRSKFKKFDPVIVDVATLFIEFLQLIRSNKCGVSFDIPHCLTFTSEKARPDEFFNPILHERFDNSLGEFIHSFVFPGLVVDNQILLRSKVITSEFKPDTINNIDSF